MTNKSPSHDLGAGWWQETGNTEKQGSFFQLFCFKSFWEEINLKGDAAGWGMDMEELEVSGIGVCDVKIQKKQ